MTQTRSHSGATSRNNLEAIGWAFASVLATSVMLILLRGATITLDSRFIVLVRFLITFALVLGFVLALTRHRANLRFSRPGLHVWRGLCFLVSAHLGFYALAWLELVTATVLMFTAPLFATLFGVMFHGEKVGQRRLLAMLAGFAGVLVVLRPDLGGVDPAMLAALGSAVLFAAALSMSRSLTQADGAMATVISSTGITGIGSLPIALPVADWSAAWIAAPILAGIIAAGIIRIFADIQAYSAGDAAVIAPITYLRLIFIGIGAYIVWNEVPGLSEMVGAAIIISAALYIAQREAWLNREPKIPKDAP